MQPTSDRPVRSNIRSIITHILQPRKQVNPIHGTPKKVLIASGDLVEPKTPPGPPPDLKPRDIGSNSKYKLS